MLGSSRVRVWRAQLSSEEELTWTQLASAGTCCHVPIWQPFLAFNLIIDQTVTDTDRPRARPHPCPRVLVSVSAWHCYPAACHGNVSTERAHIVWIVITNNRPLLPLALFYSPSPLHPIVACLPLPSARLCRHVDVKLLSSCGLNGSAENLAGKMKEEGRRKEAAGTGGGRQQQKE